MICNACDYDDTESVGKFYGEERFKILTVVGEEGYSMTGCKRREEYSLYVCPKCATVKLYE